MVEGFLAGAFLAVVFLAGAFLALGFNSFSIASASFSRIGPATSSSPFQIKNAGSIFLGEFSPEAIGDYLAGPNHVLPTSGSARFASGLSVNDFIKRTSLIKCSKRGIEKIGQMAINLANYEGLHAHALSISKRIKN